MNAHQRKQSGVAKILNGYKNGEGILPGARHHYKELRNWLKHWKPFRVRRVSNG